MRSHADCRNEKKRELSSPRRVVLLLLACAILTRPAAAQTPDLTALSLTELLDIEITTVSRKEQTLLRTAAAAYVITEDDIRRSGARTLPDLFRMVPGLAVAQVNANSWSVTARGFAGVKANKLLVLIDGRSLYAPLNGGVFWDMQLPPLDTIAQIEVIRGPGAAVWGTNAGFGESPDFLRDGGLVRFYLERNRMRVQIDGTRAAGAGLKISSQLLSLGEQRIQ